MDRTEAIRSALALWRPGAELAGVSPMGGGMSTQMLRVTFDSPQGQRSVIARFPAEYVRGLYTEAAALEAKTLVAVRAAGLPAPEPLIVCEAEDGDFLLLEFLPGVSTANPPIPDAFVRQMAGMLAKIHQVPVEPFGFLVENRIDWTPDDVEPNRDLREDEVNEAALRLRPSAFDSVVLRHGDFWPGNVLWEAGQLTGVVDWENALRGPAVADLALSRLDVAWVLGFEAMEAFTAYYLEANPIDLRDLAYWELRAAMRPMGNLPDWVAPYAALDRPDITYDSMRDTLLTFIEGSLRIAPILP